MMKTLYLHIGLPKTGTSFLQRWLSLNRDALGAVGLWSTARSINAHRLAVEFIKNERRAAREDVINIKNTSIETARDELIAAFKENRIRSGVSSSEYYFECEPASVVNLRQYVDVDNIVILIFIRRQDKIIESGFNQEVKAMRAANALGAPRYSDRLNWLKLYENWASVFGVENIRVVNYDMVAKSDRLIGAFVDALDLPEGLKTVTSSTIEDSRNQSLPANLLEFKRLANVLNGRDLEEWIHRAIEAGAGGAAFRLQPEVARQYLGFYEDSNRELARRLGYEDTNAFFPLSDLDEQQTGADFTNRLPIETVARLLAFQVRESDERFERLLARIGELERKVGGTEMGGTGVRDRKDSS